MTYRGHVQNGVVVLDEPDALPDGATVEVEILPEPVSSAEELPRGNPHRILNTLRKIGGWHGSAEEWDRLERMIQEDRDADLRRSIEAGEWGPIEDLDQDYLNQLGIDIKEVKQVTNDDLSF